MAQNEGDNQKSSDGQGGTEVAKDQSPQQPQESPKSAGIIGKDWDDSVEKSAKPADEQIVETEVVSSGDVWRGEAERPESSAPANSGGGGDAAPGFKRRRDDEDAGVHGEGGGVEDIPSYEDKRARQECYRCGGEGHIAAMCPSEMNAKNNPSLSTCHSCQGRGHFARECPKRVPPGVCFKCGVEGHRGRECHNAPRGGGLYGGGGGRGGYNDGGADAGGQIRPELLQAALSAASARLARSGGDPNVGVDAINNLNMLLGAGNQRSGGYGGGSYGGYDGGYGGYGGGGAGSGGGGGGGGGGYGSYGGFPRRNVVGSGRCFRCQEPGHWTKDCPYRPANSDPDGCYKCGKSGHRAKECNVCFKCHEYGHNAQQCTSTTQV